MQNDDVFMFKSINSIQFGGRVVVSDCQNVEIQDIIGCIFYWFPVLRYSIWQEVQLKS